MRVHRNSPSSTERRRTAAFLLVAALPTCAVLALGACTRKEADIREVPAPSAPTGASLELVPVPTLLPSLGSASTENVLAATSADATSPGPTGSPPVGSTGGGAALGARSSTCVNGWFTPERGSPLRGAVLDMMRVRRSQRFIIEEMRYFVGPEDAEVLGARGDVERWYVKASTDTEPRWRQRWLIRRAALGSGVDAIAPFDSTGYGPGIWRRPDASNESFADPFERPCQGTKPGDKCMGLPREVLGCLAGT
jgi:hypothetical protein